MIPSIAKPTFKGLIELREPFVVQGPPAVAKTDTIKQAALDAGVSPENTHVFHAAVMDPTDVKGLGALVNGNAEFVPFGKLKQLVDATEPTLGFFDDIGHGTATVQASIMQLFLERACNGTALSPMVALAAATNRKGDKAGVRGLITPLLSRFTTILEMEVSVEDWVRWAFENKMPPEVISFIRFRPALLHDWKPDAVDAKGNTMVNQPTPRTVAAVGRLFRSGNKYLRAHEVLAGAAGESFATEFLGFVALMAQLGDLPMRISKGQANGVDCPADPSTLFALTGALSNMAARGDSEWAAIAKWGSEYLPPEYQLRLLKDVEDKYGDTLVETRPFVEWQLQANAYSTSIAGGA